MSDIIDSNPAGHSGPSGSGGTDSNPPAIELRRICKRFGSVFANNNIDLTVERGTIHGIVGENGAGKSTLMSILYGFYQADSGSILINGTPAQIHSSHDAIAAGIGMVHQHFMLVETFTVLENVILGAESGALLSDSTDAARSALQHLADEYQLSVPLDSRAGDLPVGQQQRTEILKALYRKAEILILDEPTGVLTPQEADQLFRVLRTLRDNGVTIILITHKLREIMDVTSRVSVLRLGEIVANRNTSETSIEELAELMVGREINPPEYDRKSDPSWQDSIALQANDLCASNTSGLPELTDINLQVSRGEIVGIAGVAGNGQSALLEVLAGIRPVEGGHLVINGQRVDSESPHNPAQMRDLGVNHVPEDRLRLGLIKSFSAAESALLGYQRDEKFNWRMLLKLNFIRDACRRLMREFDVRPQDPKLRSSSFSGGNQQKLILARELEKSPTLLLVGQPTRGVDIGAIELIHEKLIEMRNSGCAVLLVSVELDEILALSDRILVMFEGRIVGEVSRADADKTTIGLMMANALDRAA